MGDFHHDAWDCASKKNALAINKCEKNNHVEHISTWKHGLLTTYISENGRKPAPWHLDFWRFGDCAKSAVRTAPSIICKRCCREASWCPIPRRITWNCLETMLISSGNYLNISKHDPPELGKALAKPPELEVPSSWDIELQQTMNQPSFGGISII